MSEQLLTIGFLCIALGGLVLTAIVARLKARVDDLEAIVWELADWMNDRQGDGK